MSISLGGGDGKRSDRAWIEVELPMYLSEELIMSNGYI